MEESSYGRDKQGNGIIYAKKFKKKPSQESNNIGMPTRRLAGVVRKFGHVYIYSSIASKNRIKKHVSHVSRRETRKLVYL